MQSSVRHLLPWRPLLVLCAAASLATPTLVGADHRPLTKNVPVWEFQNKAGEEGYDFNAPPKGMFRTIQFAEDFEEDLGFRRGNIYVPVNPTERFSPDARAIYIVFKLHQRYDTFQLVGLCYPEQVEGLKSGEVLTEDAVEVDMEDESGYLQLFPPKGGWRPGQYKVEIHIGWEVNATSLIGTMRFTVAS